MHGKFSGTLFIPSAMSMEYANDREGAQNGRQRPLMLSGEQKTYTERWGG
jgi:hypothetical protein